MHDDPERTAAILAETEGKPAAERCNRLAEEWQLRTMFLSSVEDQHPAYRAIVAMGKDAIEPLLLSLLSEPSWVIGALREITGVCPYSEDDRGDLARMSEAWILWGQDNGHLPSDSVMEESIVSGVRTRGGLDHQGVRLMYAVLKGYRPQW